MNGRIGRWWRAGAGAGRSRFFADVRLRGVLLLAAGAIAMSGCQLDPTDARFGGHPEVRGVALLLESGERLTSPFVFPAGGPHRLRVEFLDGSGQPIENLDQTHRSGLFWVPGGRVTTAPGSEPRTHEVTFNDACTPPTEVRVGYGHDQRVDERLFGPFPIEVDGALGAARLLAADSTELTPDVHFVEGEAAEVHVQVLDCAGEVVTGLEDEYEAILFWAPADFATWERLDEAGFHNLVTPQLPAGRTGHMSIGIRPIGAPWHQTMGPFTVTVHPAEDPIEPDLPPDGP